MNSWISDASQNYRDYVICVRIVLSLALKVPNDLTFGLQNLELPQSLVTLIFH